MYLAYKDTNILFKILPCILIAIFFVMILSSSCFAFPSNIAINEVSYNVSSFIQTFDKIFIFTDGSYYFLYVMNSDTDILVDGSLYSVSGSCYSSTISTRSLSELLSFGEDSFTLFSGGSFGYGKDIYYANFNIYDTDGNLVFQAAPQEGEQTQTIIPTKITSVDFSQVITEVLAMLPILLVVLIGLLALRKAIQLLLNLLHQS